jgi:hypothetical protein
VAAQLIQRCPEVVEPLREGKLCITVVLELARVITPENSAAVLPRFFHRSKQEAKAVAVEIRPAEVIPRKEMVTALPLVSSTPPGRVQPVELAAAQLVQGASSPTPAMRPAAPMQAEPLTPDLRRLHMTVSRQILHKLEAARAGQGHAQPGASAEKVLEAALDLLLAQQARRRGVAKKPQRTPPPREARVRPRRGAAGGVVSRRRQVPVASRCRWDLRLHTAPRDRSCRPARQGRTVHGRQLSPHMPHAQPARRPPGLRRRLDGQDHGNRP